MIQKILYIYLFIILIVFSNRKEEKTIKNTQKNKQLWEIKIIYCKKKYKEEQIDINIRKKKNEY